MYTASHSPYICHFHTWLETSNHYINGENHVDARISPKHMDICTLILYSFLLYSDTLTYECPKYKFSEILQAMAQPVFCFELQAKFRVTSFRQLPLVSTAAAQFCFAQANLLC